MRMKRLTTICLVVVLTGCASTDDSTDRAPDEYISALETLELDPDQYESDQVYYTSVLDQMDAWLKQIDSPQQLRAVFWRCYSAWQAKPESPQDKLTWIDPHAESQNLIMYRLAEIRTPAAAKVLVQLYCDPKARWDGHAAEAGGDAIVKCGEEALPFLWSELHGNARIAWLIKQIQSGADTGF